MQFTHLNINDSLMELNEHGSDDFPFVYYYEDIHKYDVGYIDWHWHREFEFVSVEEGSVLLRVGSQQTLLREGEGIFVNSGVLHRLDAVGRGIISNILFAPEFLAAEHSRIYGEFIATFLTSDISHLPLVESVPWQSGVLRQLSQIYRLCRTEESAWEIGVHALALTVWGEMFRHRNDFLFGGKAEVKRVAQARLRKMTQYIEENYASRLTLAEIAQAAGISQSEALRCFQAGMQTSPIKYLNHIRLRRAHKLLHSTTRSITDIAELTGYESVSYFDRMYKREFGTTPRDRKAGAP